MKLTLIGAIFATLLAVFQARGEELNYGDHSSATITGKAWGALNAKNYEEAASYAKKCVEMYEKEAVSMQKDLNAPVTGEREDVSKKWALNDVGTCLFIIGQAQEKLDKPTEALAAYKELVEKLPFAQCWDQKGWFWKPAEAARARMKALEFDTLK